MMKIVMKVFRKEKQNVIEFRVGDQIELGKYTATCQLTNEHNSGIFMLDQYLDKPYKRSGNLLKELNKDLTEDKNFKRIFDLMARIGISNVSEFFRLPTAGEMFGKGDLDIYLEPDHDDGSWDEQWELMKDRKNRIAIREGENYEWGWLKNRRKDTTTFFAGVDQTGFIGSSDTTFYSGGVRPVFRLDF